MEDSRVEANYEPKPSRINSNKVVFLLVREFVWQERQYSRRVTEKDVLDHLLAEGKVTVIKHKGIVIDADYKAAFRAMQRNSLHKGFRSDEKLEASKLSTRNSIACMLPFFLEVKKSPSELAKDVKLKIYIDPLSKS